MDERDVPPQPKKFNPFARKPNAEKSNASASAAGNSGAKLQPQTSVRTLRKSDTFFEKVDQAGSKGANGQSASNKADGKQTTLSFGRKGKAKETDVDESQATVDESQATVLDTQEEISSSPLDIGEREGSPDWDVNVDEEMGAADAEQETQGTAG